MTLWISTSKHHNKTGT